MRSYIFIGFILDLHTAKALTMLYCAEFGCKHDSARYIVELSFFIELSFLISSGKTDSSHNCGWAG